ncbi:MAG: rod shape determining protein RodA [Miltoncostaeaceae bacterium]|nr:rod shape determining protein RodA [Miltoncostaeaceae bacterium]
MTTFSPSAGRLRLTDRARGAVAGLDWVLIAAVVMVSGFGVYVIKAATRDDVPGAPDYYFTRQVAYMVLGLLALAVVLLVDVDRLAGMYWTLWGGLIAAVAMVFVLGSSIRGSNRWISLGAFRLQPSELGKVVLILVLAGLIVDRAAQVGTRRFSLLALGVAGLPALMIFAQPDLGTSMVYMAVLAALLFLAGVPWTQFAAFAAIVATLAVLVLWALPQAGLEVLKPYQVDRLTSFVDTKASPGDAGYQLEASKTAIGSGGAIGKGPDGATQTINDFLPEHHTDFIFAVVGEMFGFVGGGLLILVYGVLLWRGLQIVARASTQVDQLVAGGVVAMLGFQVFVNIGMNVGIMPITGIPLPFMSYGGSHTLTNLIAVGLLLRIRRRARGTA